MIVLLCRNSILYTKKCLPTLLAQVPAVQVVTMNNDSSDGTASWLSARKVPCIAYFEQKSVAYCWNEALRLAWAYGAHEVLVVNNDTELRPDTYNSLSRWREWLGAGMLTCVSVRTREEMLVDPTEITPRPHPDFSCFMIGKEAYEQVGPFDESFQGAYYEDNDYHVRMHRAGVKALSINLPFLHHGSGTAALATRKERELIELKATANRERFRAKYGCLPGTPAYERLFEVETKLAP